MSKKSTLGKLAGASILSAIAASLCCITPVLALISGAGGIASSFSWLEPARPYLLSATVLVLFFAWYQKLKPRTDEEIQCVCDEDETPPFMQTKKFLGIVTVFAFLMMTFPYYGHIFYPKVNNEIGLVSSENIQVVNFNVSGMTCASCEEHIKHAINEKQGVISVSANSKVGITSVKFDKSKIDKEIIIKTINATGYIVTGEVAIDSPLRGE